MPQSTNLNKNPYYDDFNESKNFYKVLFKPGVTVQTRELTTLQSILQSQIEKFGSAFFKKNSVVIPGGFAYDQSYYAVEVEGTYKGIDVESYFQSLVGKTLTGKNSNVTAKVETVLSKNDSIRNNTTFYVKYQSSSSNFSSNTFEDGEELVVNENINLQSGSILSGSSISKCISLTDRKSTSIGSAAKIDDGVYFIRGFFVDVKKDVLILDQYTNTPSYRVGLIINEEIINSSKDDSLYDNAQGFSNYAAPGADRLKISLSLTKKSLTDFNDENFIELFRVNDGKLIQIKNETESSFLNEILARRTFDESGNYYVNEFNVEALESLNNNFGNGGVYQKGDSTANNIEPSEDTGIIKVSPGKAYVKGYEVPTNTELLSFPKPRTVKNVQSSSSSFYTGNLLRVNNARNIPNVGLTTNASINLYNRRLLSGTTSGNQIGVARVYDFSSYITSYNNPASQFNLNLFDIQTFSRIETDSSISGISIGDYVKGNNSGASAFVKDISGQTLIVYQSSGTFIKNESIIVNGIGSTVSVGTYINYSIEDIKSISNGSFTADTVLTKETKLTGPFSIQVESGIGTITAFNGSSFASNLKVTDVIKFAQLGIGSDVYTRITNISVTKDRVTVGTLSTVPGVCSGNIGVSTSLQEISILKPEIFQIDDPSLTAKLNHQNISNVDFLNSNIYVKVQYDSISKSGAGTSITLPSLSGTDYVYSTYDASRYVVVNANNSIENLDSATFTITNGGKDAEFIGISTASGPCKVITTQIKSNVTQKYKKLSRCNSITVARTKYQTPRNAGLSTSVVYGTRVEDDQISLNVPDILNIQAVFESSTINDPLISWIDLSGINSTNGTTDDLIIGELVIGESSGAVAICAEKRNSSQISLIYKNSNTFILNEKVSFSESGYFANVAEVTIGDKNIVDEFILDNGQRSHFYDYGRLVRKNGSREPSARLKIFFDNFTFNENDYGDLISTNSYPSTLEKGLIPIFNNERNTDVIDIRPRVSNYNTLSSISPFNFSSRIFNTLSNNASQVLSPNENFVFDYDFYLPRIDKVTLSRDGVFNLVLGDPSETPANPPISSEVLDIATIVSDAYVYDIKKDVSIILSDNRRYTMSDLRDIENRVSNLEYYTSLSLLETSTQNLLIADSNGLNRFKSGFFVDEFNDYNTSDVESPNYNSLIENKSLSAVKLKERIDLSLFYTDNYTPISSINLNDTSSSNLKITGNKLSLNYNEVEASKQPFASKVVNVNPFNIITWSGVLGLNPSSDTWSTTINQTLRIRGGGSSRVESVVVDIPFIRSRNIEFTAARLKPNTRFKVLFDKKDLSSNTLNSLAFPKFIEIANVTGTFTIGETVNCLDDFGNVICSFRICSPNHKSGSIDNPSLIFTNNPYNPSVGISTQYGVQSTFLNIDTSSLTRQDISAFSGKIKTGTKLVGQTSKANASVSDIRLITDNEGVLIGSIWVDENDQFATGQTSVDLVVNDPTPKVPGEIADSSTSAVYTTKGTETRITTINYYDPLAQTFLVEDENGIVPTSIDVYFYSKDANIPVEIQIREVSLGTPGGPDKIVSGLRKVLSPSVISTSNDASIATTFTFDDLVRLPAGEYAIVLLSDSNEYQVWVSELGSEDISTVNLPTVNKIFITRQPSLGTLFKSQNGTTWVPSPLEDLKFTLKKANFITTGGTARFYNSTVNLKSQENKLPNNPITAISTSSNYPNDGRHIMVFHPNHGMHSSNNQIIIDGVQSDILPVKLTVSYGATETGSIQIADASLFTTFEGSPVANTNPGYVKISNEIIKYENYDVGTNSLLNVTRGQFGTIPENHSINSLVYKYEFNNVSLSRINTQFTIVNNPQPTVDTYYVQVTEGSLFSQTKTAGGSNVYSTKNKQFSEIEFNNDFISTFNNTQATASIRSITSTSVDGSEVSFVDKGFETIGINTTNVFDTPRMVASKINESTYLNSTNFIGNKSFTVEFNLNTSDSNVSPIINLNQNYAIGSIYNINQPVDLSSYPSDSRVNSNTDDPHSFVYVTNKINLEQDANSLQVLFSAYRNASSEIRVLYKIYTDDVPDNDQVWQLFPGYGNLDVNGNIIDFDNNDGRPDSNIRSSLIGEYLDYKYSIDNLPPFTGFQIKIVGTSSNQSYSPIIKELRVISLK